MNDAEIQEWTNVFGVKVKNPIDMPDDILKFAIELVKEEFQRDIDLVSKGKSLTSFIKLLN